MDDTHWQRIDDLFGRALEVETDQRVAFVAQQCGDDEALQRAVHRLLALEVEAASFLAEPIAVLSVDGGLEATGVLDGLRIGPYRLLRPLGHGGMGSVYLARREDDYRQEVAIKLIRQSLLNEELQRRFASERQILARLEHPNIARLYDGGATAEGLPYLVMERVEGLPIDRFCDHHRLTLRQRLELFCRVCATVDYAHGRGLVHCDLKPSNILVTADGAPKLLDFGIAKLLQPEATDDEITGAHTGPRPATPSYASPEQLLGLSITFASDVYSLGVLLYKLLSGSLPFVHKKGEPHGEMAAAVYEQEAEKPSRRVLAEGPTGDLRREDSLLVSARRRTTPKELSRRLRGDLDEIVLRALRHQPAQRYGSAEALARDIGRHLAALPVQARRGTWRYRTTRLLRRIFWPPDPRHRGERLLWSGLLALVLAASLGVSSLRRPAVPCDDALERLAGVWDSPVQAQARGIFLATGLPYAEDLWRRTERRLSDYAEAWVAMHRETCEATYLRGEQSEQMLDARMLCLADRREELRATTDLLTDAAELVLQRVPQMVTELPTLAACADRAELSNLEPAPSDPAARQQIDRVRAVSAEQLVRYYTRRPADVEALRRAVETAREVGYRPTLAQALLVLGIVESFEGGDSASGVGHLEEALLAAIAGGDRRLQARIYASLVRVEIRQNGNAEAARRWADYAEASLAALGSSHDDLLYEVTRALGLLAHETGDDQGAVGHYGKALEIAERSLGTARQIAALTSLGMLGEAEYLERAIALTRQEFGPRNPNMVRPLHNLAGLYAYDGRYDEAVAMALQALEVLEVTFGERYPENAYTLILIGQILSSQGRPSEALPYLQRALPLVEDGFGDDAPLAADIRHALADALRWLGRYDEALQHALAADRIYAATRESSHYTRLMLLGTLGSIQRQQGDLPSALRSHLRLLELISEQQDSSSSSAVLYLAIGETLVEAGRLGAAVTWLEKARDIDAQSSEPLRSARIRFALARANAATSPSYARQLAAEALVGLTEQWPLQTQLRASIELWLAPSPPP